MSHVDEGMLHAWLDAEERGPEAVGMSVDEHAALSAHLATCQRCTRALADALAVRSSAEGVLGAASPAEVPPALGLPSVRRHRRVVPLAWAASVVLALGAGWIGNELVRQGVLRPEVESLVRAPSPAGSSEPLLAEHPEESATLDGDGTGALGAAGPTSPGPAAPLAPQAAAAGAGAANRQPAEREARRAADAAETSQAAAPAPAPGQVTAKAQPPVPHAAADQLERRTEPARAEAAAGEAALQQSAAAARQFSVAPASPALPPAAGATDTLGYAGDAAVEWVPATRALAVQRLGAPLELLPGEVTAIALAEPGGVRVRQRLEDGAEVELVQWRAPAGAVGQSRVLAAGTAADGRAYAILLREGRVVSLKAPRGADALALLELLRRE